MIITRTPYRISFFGGGTDFPDYYNISNNGGVISASINKYCYISLRELLPYFKHKHRLCYSKIELVNSIDEIEHPSAKAILNHFLEDKGLEIHYDGDVPARSGLGSSSAFTVGLIKAISDFKSDFKTKKQIVQDALFIEQNILKEAVGTQDQVAVTYGGLNHISFNNEKNFEVNPINLSTENKDMLIKNSLLFFTGVQRFAVDVEKDKIQNIDKIWKNLDKISEIRDQALNYFKKDNIDINNIGLLLDVSWKEKMKLSQKVSLDFLNEAYDEAVKCGALGGKLLGAGGGGFMYFIAPPETHSNIEKKLKSFIKIDFKFDEEGTKTIFRSNEK